jgi:hypothetical protein
MEITREMQETMIVSLLRHDKTPSGVECSFFQFGTVGVKFYGYGSDARIKAKASFASQVKCYAAGVAPKPGKMFSVPIKGAGKYGEAIQLHGYTTEVAIVLRPDQNATDFEREVMYDSLEAAGLPCGDLHSGNIGYVVDEKNDCFKLVPIDFGSHFALSRLRSDSDSDSDNCDCTECRQ